MAQLLVKPDGWRDRDFRPYIEQEETDIFSYVWSPYHSRNYGLYSETGPNFHMFKDDVLHYNQQLGHRYPKDAGLPSFPQGKYFLLGQLP